MNDVRVNIMAGNQWVRLLYMLFFCLCLYLASLVVPIIVVAQFLFALITGSDNEQLRRFSWSLTLYIKETLLYLTYNSDHKTFPFDDWPGTDELDRRVDPEALDVPAPDHPVAAAAASSPGVPDTVTPDTQPPRSAPPEAPAAPMEASPATSAVDAVGTEPVADIKPHRPVAETPYSTPVTTPTEPTATPSPSEISEDSGPVTADLGSAADRDSVAEPQTDPAAAQADRRRDLSDNPGS